jgi:hypothetical protein
MNFNPEDYKDKRIYLTAPLGNTSVQQRIDNLEAWTSTTKKLFSLGLKIETDPRTWQESDVVWILLLPCSPTDEVFLNDLQEIFNSKKLYSTLNYPDFDLEPIRRESRFLKKNTGRKLTFK